MGIRHEQIIIDKLNSFNVYDTFKLVDDKYNSYDAYNKDFIVEIKWRHKWYEDQIIEELKVWRNLDAAKETGKDYIYLVRTPKASYAWNISKMMRDGWEWKFFERRLPVSTDFGNNQWKVKTIATLYYKDAIEFKINGE